MAHCGGNPTWPIHQSRIVDSPTGLQKQVPTDIPENSSHRGTEELREVGAMNSRVVVGNPNSPHFEHCLRSMRCAPQFGALYDANVVLRSIGCEWPKPAFQQSFRADARGHFSGTVKRQSPLFPGVWSPLESETELLTFLFKLRPSIPDDRRAAERPTSTDLVRSYQRATDLVSEWPRASRSSCHVGGMSRHDPNSPVALGRACFWLSLVWLGAGASRWLVGLGVLFSVPFARAPTQGPVFLPQASLDCLGLRVGGPPGCVRRDGSGGWRSPVSRATILGGGIAYYFRQPSPSGPADRFRRP